MASYKPTLETVIHDRIGFTDIPLTYEVDGFRYPSIVVLKDAENNIIQKDEYHLRQFSGLTESTTYSICSVYLDDYGDVVDVIPDSESVFTTKAVSSFIPTIIEKTENSITVGEFINSIWDSGNSLVAGFGVGIEVLDIDGNVVAYSTNTPAKITLTSGEYTVRASVWTGSSTNIKTKKEIPNTSISVSLVAPTITLIANGNITSADLEITLNGFVNPTTLKVLLNGVEIFSMSDGISNKTYEISITDIAPITTYNVVVDVIEYDGRLFSANSSFTTKTEPTDILSNEFKDFWIAVGQPGAYSKNMEYTEVFGMNARFGIKIKHAPYSPMAKIKNVVTQSWKDENGDDVWLPRAIDKDGNYIPAITHESVEYNPVFVIFGDKEVVNSNSAIRDMLQLIEGRWLKIWDEYTQMGFEGVYLTDVDDDPKFKRRNYDFVQFTLKFKINGTNIDAPFEGVGSK